MFFCDKCRYMFNVTKDVKNNQRGGKMNNAIQALFDKFRENKPLEDKDLVKLKGKDITDDQRFDTLTKKDQRRIISWIKSYDRSFFNEEQKEDIIGTNAAFFICKYCKNSKPIKPGTLIYSKNYDSINTNEEEDYALAINDLSLARTRNYICKNPECSTHDSTNSTTKEAVLTKNKMEQIVYICTTCTTNWTTGV